MPKKKEPEYELLDDAEFGQTDINFKQILGNQLERCLMSFSIGDVDRIVDTVAALEDLLTDVWANERKPLFVNDIKEIQSIHLPKVSDIPKEEVVDMDDEDIAEWLEAHRNPLIKVRERMKFRALVRLMGRNNLLIEMEFKA